MKRPLAFLVAATLAMVLTAPGEPFAAIPDPTCSVCPPCIVIDPSGSFPNVVNVQSIFCQPIGGSHVVIDFDGCSTFCPVQPSGITRIGNTFNTTTDALGNAHFPIKGGGCCQGPIRVYADGVLLCSFSPSHSPDMNGDLLVNVADLGLWAAAQPTGNPCGDFNCDGLVNIKDLAIWAVSQSNGGC